MSFDQDLFKAFKHGVHGRDLLVETADLLVRGISPLFDVLLQLG